MITESEVHKIPGERWTPADDPSSPRYRVPIKGTINALVSKHDAFLKRIGPDGFNPVPPLTAFTTVGYRRAADPPPRTFAAFSLLKPDASGFRSFDAARQGIALAGMMRHAASAENLTRALRWPPDRIAGFILGHAEPHGQPHVPVPGRDCVHPTPEYRVAWRGPR